MKIKTNNLEYFVGGWIVGDFFPSLIHTKELEIGLLHLKANYKTDQHYHKLHQEINVILRGKIKIGGDKLSKGDIFIYQPYDKSDFIVLEDTDLLVIKHPATKHDKYYDNNSS